MRTRGDPPVERCVKESVLSHSSPVLEKAILMSRSGYRAHGGGNAGDDGGGKNTPRVQIGDYTERQVDSFLSLLCLTSSSVSLLCEQVSLQKDDLCRVSLPGIPLLKEYRCHGVLSLLKQIVLLQTGNDSFPSLFPLVDSLLRADEDRGWATEEVLRMEVDCLLSVDEEGGDEVCRKKVVKARMEGMDADLFACLLLASRRS